MKPCYAPPPFQYYFSSFHFTPCKLLLGEVAIKDEPHFLGPDSVAGCCGASAVSSTVNQTAWATVPLHWFLRVFFFFLMMLKFVSWAAWIINPV